MYKVGLFFAAFLLLLTIHSTSYAKISNSSASPTALENSNIPEVSGDYQEPGQPGVRVRVFVHGAKGKPTVNENAVCSADNDSNAIVGSTGWKLPNANWTYKLNAASVPSTVGGSNLQSIAQNGFSAWTDSISDSAKPVLVYGGNTSKTRSSYDNQNIIAWGRASSGALGVTYVRYYTSTGQVVDVDTIMNNKYAWTLNTCSATRYDAADILTHELGHWFGLNDEYASEYVDNTMYGYGSKAETKKVTLTGGDVAGINLIY